MFQIIFYINLGLQSTKSILQLFDRCQKLRFVRYCLAFSEVWTGFPQRVSQQRYMHRLYRKASKARCAFDDFAQFWIFFHQNALMHYQRTIRIGPISDKRYPKCYTAVGFARLVPRTTLRLTDIANIFLRKHTSQYYIEISVKRRKNRSLNA